MEAELLKQRAGHKCTLTVVWSIVLRAASRMISIFAACRDLSNAPSQQAVFDALEAGLPRTLPVLEKRLNRALTGSWPRPKKKKPKGAKKGLRWLKRQKAGWYQHTLKNGKETLTISVCVAYRTYYHRKKRKHRSQKLLFAAWRVRGAPTAIHERYRKRFGIESSFRQMRQARIYTCTPNPHLRLVFVGVALLLRNLWVWIHATMLAEGRGPAMTLQLELLRFKRMLDWIAQAVAAILHDRSMPCVVLNE